MTDIERIMLYILFSYFVGYIFLNIIELILKIILFVRWHKK